MSKEERVRKFRDVDLYPVTCEELSLGRSNLEVLEGVIQGGARIIQLREKSKSRKEFYDLAKAFKKRCAEANVLLIINDHLDVALSVGADGVHLGQDDFPLKEARKLAPDLILGASTHSREQALRAQDEGADYYNIGPIFPTTTKAHLSHFLGPEAIGEISKGIQLPFTVMGGIKKEHIPTLVRAGARRIAVVTAVTKEKDIPSAIADLRRAITKGDAP